MFLWDFYMNEKMWNSVRHWFTFVEVEPWQPQSLSSDRGMVYYVALSSYPLPLKRLFILIHKSFIFIFIPYFFVQMMVRSV